MFMAKPAGYEPAQLGIFIHLNGKSCVLSKWERHTARSCVIGMERSGMWCWCSPADLQELLQRGLLLDKEARSQTDSPLLH